MGSEVGTLSHCDPQALYDTCAARGLRPVSPEWLPISRGPSPTAELSFTPVVPRIARGSLGESLGLGCP